jgi:hypothetical protein
VTQTTTRATAVTINALCGTITTDTTSLAAEVAASFTVNNSAVQIGDGVILTQQSGAVGLMTTVEVILVTNGSFKIARLANACHGDAYVYHASRRG